MVFFLLLFAGSAVGQSSMLGQSAAISVSFTGTYKAHYAQLSKINIQNLNQNCDTTLYWPDTVLYLIPMGTNDLHLVSREFQVFQNIPNPVRENTKILLYLPERGNVTIDISLLSGKQAAFFSQELQSGYHSFLFTPGSAETYIFTASCKAMKRSIKIVSIPVRSSPGCILTYNGTENEPVSLKSAAMQGKFTFQVGDTLLFIGYYDTLTTAFQDAPAINKTYTFNFIPSVGISCPGIPAISYMGQIYHTVQIGTQCWLKENLNVGTRIDDTRDQKNNGIIEKYCYNSDTNCAIYGGLYQWNEMMQYSRTQGTQGICPTGWHLPTDAEWTALTETLGGDLVAGAKMKETGTAHWVSPNWDATNSSGFTALPGGCRNYGSFYDLTECGYFWSSSTCGTNYAFDRYISYGCDCVYHTYSLKSVTYSVRCVKD
jgi:uncharacterized protein (TIGR02145 family)